MIEVLKMKQDVVFGIRRSESVMIEDVRVDKYGQFNFLIVYENEEDEMVLRKWVPSYLLQLPNGHEIKTVSTKDLTPEIRRQLADSVRETLLSGENKTYTINQEQFDYFTELEKKTDLVLEEKQKLILERDELKQENERLIQTARHLSEYAFNPLGSVTNNQSGVTSRCPRCNKEADSVLPVLCVDCFN